MTTKQTVNLAPKINPKPINIMLIPRYIGLRVYLKGPMIASFEACEGCIGLMVVSSCLKTLAAEIKTDKPQIIIITPSGVCYSKVKGSISLFEKPIKKIKIRVTIGGGIFVSIKKIISKNVYFQRSLAFPLVRKNCFLFV